MEQTVIGIFKSKSDAQDAVDELLSDGFLQEDVDVSTNNEAAYAGTAGETNTEKESGVGKFFKNLFGMDDDENKRYTTVAERGTIVTVHAESKDEADRVVEILDRYGAEDVNAAYDEYSQAKVRPVSDQQFAYNTPTAASDTAAAISPTVTSSTAGAVNPNPTNKNAAADSSHTVSIIEETLQVGKREVETGGVRLRSRIVEKPVEESLRLRQEHVKVERNKVNRAATDSDLTTFKEGTIELVETAEVPVVSKEARIVEEVTLSKEVAHSDETIKDTVRKTEVDVENL